MSPPIIVISLDRARSAQAEAFAREQGLPLADTLEVLQERACALVFAGDAISLRQREGKHCLEVCVDFTEGAVAHRRQFGGGKGQMIARAVGVSAHFIPRVLDATAGLGRDAFVLATLGMSVSLLERSTAVHALLADGLLRATRFAETHGDAQLLAILQRMTLVCCDARDYFPVEVDTFDVVYLDPMFPERKKTALVKKEMRIFHQLVGEDADADALLDQALNTARYRVVVKRPKIAPFLAGRKPSYQLQGKSSRFDIYTLRALPER